MKNVFAVISLAVMFLSINAEAAKMSREEAIAALSAAQTCYRIPGKKTTIGQVNGMYVTLNGQLKDLLCSRIVFAPQSIINKHKRDKMVATIKGHDKILEESNLAGQEVKE